MYIGLFIKQIKEKRIYRITIQYLAILVAAYIVSILLSDSLWPENVNLFHTSFELLCIFIALASFLVVWLTYENNSPSNRIIGFGFLAVAIFDTMHTYSFSGLGLYPDGKYGLSTWYWILGRFYEALILLISTMKIFRFKLNRWVYLFITLPITLAISVFVFNYFNVLPVILTSSGVTGIKKIFEYIIILLFIAGFIRISKRAVKRDIFSYEYICMAILIVIPAELCFTLFTTITSFYNTLGHVLKVVYYFFLFKAIFASAVTYPYQNSKVSKNKLRLWKNELKNILNGLPVAIITYNNSSKVSFVNKKAFELMEFNQSFKNNSAIQEIMEKYMIDIKHLILQLKHQPFKTIHSAGQYRTFKGNIINLNVNLFKYKNGFLASFSDVAKEQQFNELQVQTRTILNAINNLVVIMDTNLNVITLNKAFSDCVEIEYDNIIGMNLNELYKTIQFTINNSSNEISWDGATDNNPIEASITTPYGAKKYIIFHHNSILDLDNKAIGYIIVASDITQYKKDQEKILRQEKLAIIGQMGSGIVHETKNHLASIKGYCQLLSQKVHEEQLMKYISRIEDISADLNRVIVDFLTIAKPSETIMDICSLNEIIESMRYMLESPSFMKNVKIDLSLSNENIDIIADEAQIKQVVLNMAKNAIEAMSDTTDARLLISTGQGKDSDELILTISDNGKGISKEDLKRIGTPFFTTKDTGTGLGLCVSYKIIEEHGGQIDVQSVAGKGTTFTISFPAYGDSNEEEYDDEDMKIS